MANQVKLLKISATGVPLEMSTTADEITLLSFTVQGGGPLLDGTGLDLNNQALSDAGSVSFTDPATDGITVTAGTLIADDILGDKFVNVMEVDSAIRFPVVTDDADELSALRLPAIAGTPSATPTGGEATVVWDSSNDKMYVWDGAAWKDMSLASEAQSIQNTFTAGAGGIAARDVVYISAADTVLKAQGTASGNESYAIGFAVAAASAGNPVEVQSAGIMGGFSTLTAGARYFVSPATAGAITSTLPIGSGNVIVQVGYARDVDEVFIDIQQLGRRA